MDLDFLRSLYLYVCGQSNRCLLQVENTYQAHVSGFDLVFFLGQEMILSPKSNSTSISNRRRRTRFAKYMPSHNTFAWQKDLCLT